jgi:tRNA(fMet)-specific endonuclease VapC
LILDTNAVSAAADDAPAVRSMLAAASEIALPVIVIGEYRYGIAQCRYQARYQRWLDNLIADCRILEITEQTTHFYAGIQLALKQAGKPIPINDLWIAALCLQHRLPLLSRDSHFDGVSGIRRLGW